MVKTLKNIEIFTYANNLLENMNDATEHLPVKISFYLQKNMSAIVDLAREIEKNRTEILEKYRTPAKEDDAEGTVEIPPENIEHVNNELNDLFNLTQEVNINMLKLDWFDGIDLTTAQVNAISFMIEE